MTQHRSLDQHERLKVDGKQATVSPPEPPRLGNVSVRNSVCARLELHGLIGIEPMNVTEEVDRKRERGHRSPRRQD